MVVDAGGGVAGGIDDDGTTVGDADGVTDDDGTTVGDADGVTDGETTIVGDGLTGATVAEVEGITGARTGGTLEVAPVAWRMSNGFVAFGPGWLPP